MRCYKPDAAAPFGFAPCEDYGARVRELVPFPLAWRTLDKPLSRRVRRQIARRQSGRGRRRSRRVSRFWPVYLPIVYKVLDRHVLRYGRAGDDVGLYLPEGVSPTDDDCNRLEATVRAEDRERSLATLRKNMAGYVDPRPPGVSRARMEQREAEESKERKS